MEAAMQPDGHGCTRARNAEETQGATRATRTSPPDLETRFAWIPGPNAAAFPLCFI